MNLVRLAQKVRCASARGDGRTPFNTHEAWKCNPIRRRMSADGKKLPVLALLGALVALLCFPAGAAAQGSNGSVSPASAALSAKIIAWANANLASYKQAVNYAKNGPPPQAPVPPLIDPPCRSCDAADTPTPGEAQVAAWIKQSEAPEAGYIASLVAIGKQLGNLNGVGNGVLTPAAQKAIAPFSEDEVQNAIERLSDRQLNGKAIPMAQKYDSKPKRAYAGISFLIKEAKEAALIHGSGYSGPAQAVELATTWQQSIAKTIDNDIAAGHKYNLCPVYGTIYKELQLLGGEIDMDSVLANLKKLQNLLTFDVKMNLQVSSHVKNGTSLDVTWSGTAKLKLKLNAAGNKTCYSPELEGGRQIAMTVDSFKMVSDTDGPMELTSARSFNMPIGFIQLNLCDQQPLLQLPLVSGAIPQETLTAKGHAMQTSLLQTYLSAVVQANHTNKPKVNAMTGKSPQASAAESADGSALTPLEPPLTNEPLTPLVPSSSYPSNDTPNDPIKNAMQDVDNKQQDAELKAAQQQVAAHRGDASWIMSAEGQKAIANLQKLALAKVQAKLAGAGIVVPNANNVIDLANSVYSAQLPWANGAAQPVNELLKVHKDQLDIYLTISVQQAAQ